jgi:hypothetical protein
MTASGIYQVIVRRGRQCGVDVFPHRFRHHFSHTWLDRGGAEGDLMQLNGWTSPQMLRRYGASARSARARRSYDRVMGDTPLLEPAPSCRFRDARSANAIPPRRNIRRSACLACFRQPTGTIHITDDLFANASVSERADVLVSHVWPDDVSPRSQPGGDRPVAKAGVQRLVDCCVPGPGAAGDPRVHIGPRPGSRPVHPSPSHRHSNRRDRGRSPQSHGALTARPRTTPPTSQAACRPAAGPPRRPAECRKVALSKREIVRSIPHIRAVGKLRSRTCVHG